MIAGMATDRGRLRAGAGNQLITFSFSPRDQREITGKWGGNAPTKPSPTSDMLFPTRFYLVYSLKETESLKSTDLYLHIS